MKTSTRHKLSLFTGGYTTSSLVSRNQRSLALAYPD